MIKNNLKNIFDEYNRKLGKNKLSVYKLSKLTDIPRTTLNRLMDDQLTSMNGKTLNNLITFFDVPVNKMIIYQRDPYKFKLINASQLNVSKLPKMIKRHLDNAVALHSVDFQQTIIFIPSINIKVGNDEYLTYDNAHKYKAYFMDYKVKYTDITKYPVYNAIQCANTINGLHWAINKFGAKFHLMSYIVDAVILHSGLISKQDDYKCNHKSVMQAHFKGLRPTVYNSNYFKLDKSVLASIQINNTFDREDSKLGFFESQLNTYRKKYGHSSKNGYELELPHVKLIDETSIKFKNDNKK